MHDLRRIRAFHEVAERKSFSEAALALGYAQSVVSHHIAALEAEVGLTLIDRTSRPVRLTSAGEQLDAHAVEILGTVAAAEDTLRSLAGMHSGVLRIGAFSTACMTFLPVAMAAFEQAHPGVKIALELNEPFDALRRVRAGDIDLAVAFTHRPLVDHTADDDALESSILGNDPFVLVLPPDHRLAKRRRLRPVDLAGERFCAPQREGTGATYRDMLDQLGAEGGFEPTVVYPVVDVNVARALVAAGLGVAVMGRHTIPAGDTSVVTRQLPGTLAPSRTIIATRLRDRRMPAIDRMLPLLQRAAAVQMGGAPASA
jgi:DNA-binding transcriptional LysR family regulator